MPESSFGSDLELRSEPVQEIIGREPIWIIRWGITVVFFTVLMLLLGTWVIKYPEILTTEIQITTQTPPVKVVSRTSGKIVKFFVEENGVVASGAPLVLLENTAEYDHVFQLKQKLADFRGFLLTPEDYLEQDWDKNVVLGDLQLTYSGFIKDFLAFQTYTNDHFFRKKITAAESQILNYEKLNQKLQSQISLLEQDLALFQQKLAKNRQLFEQNLIAENDLGTIEGQYLEKKYSVGNASTALINNQIRIDELRQTIFEYEQQDQERYRDLLVNAQNAYKGLLAELSLWEQRYLLSSPAAGNVSFFKFWSDNQYVQLGDEVMTIVPERNDLVGKIYLPQQGSGKVATGHPVHIKFQSYPYREFGIVTGKVATFSLVPRENLYLVNVTLPNGLHTNYNKDLEFKHNMMGTADIITEDLRLIDRIFNQFRSLLKSAT